MNKLACLSMKETGFDEGKDFQFVGPLGFGLEIGPDCVSSYLFIIKDEGILPFLDLLEYIEQTLAIQFHRQSGKSHFLFQNEFKLSFCNEPKFYMFWDVSPNFQRTAEILVF